MFLGKINKQGQRAAHTMCARPQHPDSLMVRRWIEAKIREIEIKSDKHSTLGTADIEYCLISASRKTLVANRMHVVTGIAQQIGRIAWKVFVQLEPNDHPSFMRKSERSARARVQLRS